MAGDRINYEPVWAGESIEIPFGLKGVDSLNGYDCKIQFLDSDGALVSGVDRAVEDKEVGDSGERFIGVLSGTETSVSPGLYTVVARIRNEEAGLVKYSVQGIRLEPAPFVDGS